MGKNIRSIFICHSSNDKSFVDKLAHDLVKHGINVWYDKWEIKVGDSIVQKINDGMIHNFYMGVVLSPNSVNSAWVKKELNSALMEELKNDRVKVLPILFKECKIPAIISDKKYADFRSSYKDGLYELLGVFKVRMEMFNDEEGKIFIDNHIANMYEDNFISGFD